MSVSAACRGVNIAYLSHEIIELSAQIGKMEGIAQEKGFPAYPVAPKVDSRKVVLDHFNFQGADQTARSMRVEIDVIYQRFHLLSSGCSLIPNPEIREIFERQIKALHEKRALLEGSLRSFQNLLRSHHDFKKAESSLRDIQEIIQGDRQGDFEIDFGRIRKQIKDLELEVKTTILPLVKGSGPEFCNLHWEKKQELFDIVHMLRTKLNLKEIKERDGVRGTVEQLLNKFAELQHLAGKVFAQVKIKKEIYTAFQTFPIKFLEEISEQISNLSLEQKDVLTDMDSFTTQPNLNLVEQALKNALLIYPSYRPLSMCIVEEQIGEEQNAGGTEQESPRKDLETLKQGEISIATSENVKADENEQTVITIKCKDVPDGQKIFIRGNGPGLNWEKGIPLVRIDWETWELRIAKADAEFEYKFVLNDENSKWEEGDNHKIVPGKKEVIQPGFSSSILPSLQKTIIEVDCKVPQGKMFYLLGNGPLGNWDKKVQLNPLGDDRWYLSFDGQFPNFEYKFQLGDAWEQGENHIAECGEKYHLSSPRF
jgi:hypothetical protein